MKRQTQQRENPQTKDQQVQCLLGEVGSPRKLVPFHYYRGLSVEDNLMLALIVLSLAPCYQTAESLLSKNTLLMWRADESDIDLKKEPN